MVTGGLPHDQRHICCEGGERSSPAKSLSFGGEANDRKPRNKILEDSSEGEHSESAASPDAIIRVKQEVAQNAMAIEEALNIRRQQLMALRPPGWVEQFGGDRADNPCIVDNYIPPVAADSDGWLPPFGEEASKSLTVMAKRTLPYPTLLYSTLLYSTTYSTLLYSTLLYSTLLYSTLSLPPTLC